MTAAQLFAAAARELPNLREQIGAGQFGALNDFLDRKVWSQASIYETDEVLRRATGEALDAKYFEAHLRKRYLEDPR
jgi:carboxypeptidase Taq